MCDYCPECGDNRYVKGESCINCDFPHMKDRPLDLLTDWELGYEDWLFEKVEEDEYL